MAGNARELLKNVTLFSGLGEDALDRLAQQMRHRTFRRGTMIFHKDQVGDALYVVESGRVRIFLPTESGAELWVEFAARGNVFGEVALLDELPRSASAETVEDTEVYTISRDDFRRFVTETPQFAWKLIALLSDRLRHVTDYAESLAFLDVHARLARVLLEMSERYGVKKDSTVEIDLDLTQADLATMVGATRERVNRALAAFRSQRTLELRGRKIVILDPVRLRQRIY
ncbi:MAG TPA: Crp/Fnr family transcriptional regulator [bacterium]|nr:Crp/Fnr family transcriptional regulator [bacterium]